MIEEYVKLFIIEYHHLSYMLQYLKKQKLCWYQKINKISYFGKKVLKCIERMRVEE
jgi:hypothetical protein